MVDRRTFLQSAASATGVLVGANAAYAQGSDTAGAVPAGTYRAYELGEQKGIETLRLVERPIPAPARGQALIRVHASSINARDLGIAAGIFIARNAEDRIPLSEGAGEVVAVGEDVTNVQAGDRVTACHFADWVEGPWNPQAAYARDVGNTIDGWLAEYVLMPAKALAVLPDNLSSENAATFISSGVTAWRALFEDGKVKAGDTVLTLGTGGVSTFGLKLAKMAGAKVVITSSSDKKLERMRELGADVTINYRTTPEWGAAVLEQTSGKGADIVLENVGRPTLDQSMTGTAVSGRVILIGTGPMPEQLPRLPGIYTKNITLKGISNASRRMLEDMIEAASVNGLTAEIDREFSFDNAKAAYERMRARDRAGKVIIKHV